MVGVKGVRCDFFRLCHTIGNTESNEHQDFPVDQGFLVNQNILAFQDFPAKSGLDVKSALTHTSHLTPFTPTTTLTLTHTHTLQFTQLHSEYFKVTASHHPKFIVTADIFLFIH